MMDRAIVIISAVILLSIAIANAGQAVSPTALPDTPAAARAAASPDTPSLAAFKKSIRKQYDMKEKAFAAHDAETIVTQFYTQDVITVGEGEGIFVGRDQIRPLYQKVVKDNTVRIRSAYTYVNGNAGWDWADFHVTPQDPQSKPFTFAILFLWANINGKWMCKGDFFVNGSFSDGRLMSSTPGAQ